MRTLIIAIPAALFLGSAVAGTPSLADAGKGKAHGSCASKGNMADFHALHPHGIVAVQTENGTVFVDTRDGTVIKRSDVPKQQESDDSDKTMI